MKWMISLLALSWISGLVQADEPEVKREYPYQANLVVESLEVPWGMVQLPDGTFLVSERKGELLHIDLANNKRTKIKGLPTVSARRQGGLLDIELDPNYSKEPWIYFSLATSENSDDKDSTHIIRAKLGDGELVELQTLYKAAPDTARPFHFGSRIEFDRQGLLYFSIGDRGQRDDFPQDTSVDNGKVYRINKDGSIPNDNPFVDKEKPAIYSYGHRNPQGMMLNPETGSIWVNEHGPRGGDEVNVIKKAANYGWPVVSYGINYNGTSFTDLTEKEGMESPDWYWVPSIAPSGMIYVSSDRYPEWKGKVLVGSLKFGYLVLLTIDGDKVVEEEVVMPGIGRVRNVRQMPDGYIYVAIDGDGIKRIESIEN